MSKYNNMSAKYITFHNDVMPTIVVFPAHLEHKIISDKLEIKPMGAGFVEGGECVGYSKSLNIGVHKEDQSLLNIFIEGAFQKEVVNEGN